MKQKFISIVLCFCFSLVLSKAATYTNNANNVLYVKSATCIKGGSVELSVALKNNVSISGFQFDLYLPSGVTVASETDAWGDESIETAFSSGRGNPSYFTYMSSFPEANNHSHVRVLCYSMNKTLSGTDGVVATVKVNVSSSVANGTYNVILKETSVSNSTDTYVNTNSLTSTLVVGSSSGAKRDVTIADGSLTTYSVAQDEEVASITYTRNFKNTGWQALYVPFAINYSDWSDQFEIGYVEGFLSFDTDGDGTIDEIRWSGVKITSGTILPNTPYLIRAKTTGAKTLLLRNTTLYATEINTVDCSSTTMKYEFIGQYENDSFTAGSYPYYINNGNFARVSQIIPFRWILRMSSRGNSFISITRAITGSVRDDDGTPFDEYVMNNPEKFENAVVYTLDGKCLDLRHYEMPKGKILIKNGKKVIYK